MGFLMRSGMGGNCYAYVNVIGKRNDANGIRFITIDEGYTLELPFLFGLMSEEFQDDILFRKHDEGFQGIARQSRGNLYIRFISVDWIKRFWTDEDMLLSWNRFLIHSGYCETNDMIEKWMTVSYREVEAVEGYNRATGS
ncbi:uncharacterized protein EAE97_010333 [Botrytis byssoidea]|uniref:Uncharacterized protein n=1 Tax=Botrytis byssoidea TaxID=139641 RepID=A0A9P5I0F0_9HELO|nr:uncharacterized protein EAE97_010333 [Botrytis byssoidea]KAF7926033.1 hypothetical protein EAE97_010333 [Botrytis byssoidea]